MPCDRYQGKEHGLLLNDLTDRMRASSARCETGGRLLWLMVELEFKSASAGPEGYHTLAYRPDATQQPRNKQIYDSRY
jgi:hypothetical protein